MQLFNDFVSRDNELIIDSEISQIAFNLPSSDKTKQIFQDTGCLSKIGETKWP